MAWTNPRTWVTAEVVTAATMNTHVRDNLDFLFDVAAGVRLNATSGQSIAAAGTIVAWNAEEWDTNGFHDNATNNSRLTIPTGFAGKYLIIASVKLASATDNTQTLQILKNGVSGIATTNRFQDALFNPILDLSRIVDLAVADYIEVKVFHGYTSSLVLDNSTELTTFEAMRIA